ncbi:hypothetical protein [Vibrio metschnikovii]|uniref:hypothetical protein n=1 Tax=Vibrio metschnikovii TaxID=28172 RepID=UPI002FC59481
MSSAGALGSGTFTYLKPIDFCNVSSQAFYILKPEMQTIYGKWLNAFELTGLHQINYLTITANYEFINVGVRLEFDGIIRLFTARSSGNAIIANHALSSGGGLTNLIIKDYLKVSVQVYDDSFPSVNDAGRIQLNIACRYNPMIVESV